LGIVEKRKIEKKNEKKNELGKRIWERTKLFLDEN